jgi:predicted nucleic acid-binding protein
LTEELLVSATVSAEVCYLLETRAGSKSEAAFLRLFPAGKLVPVDITAADYERMAELVELYADWPLGGTDASLIAIAERLGVTNSHSCSSSGSRILGTLTIRLQ